VIAGVPWRRLRLRALRSWAGFAAILLVLFGIIAWRTATI